MATSNVNLTINTGFSFLQMGFDAATSGVSPSWPNIKDITTPRFPLIAVTGCANSNYSGEPTEVDQRLASIMSAFRGQGPAVCALFLVLWDAKPKVLTREEIEERWHALATFGPGKHRLWQGIARLRGIFKKLNWPIKIKNKFDQGYRLVVRPASWSWEQEAGTSLPMRNAHVRSVNCNRHGRSYFRKDHTPALFGYLTNRLGEISTGEDLVSVVRQATGNPTALLDWPIRRVRDLIRDEKLPYRLSCVPGIGYRLDALSQRQSSPKGPFIISDLRDWPRQPPKAHTISSRKMEDLFSNDRVAEVMNTLGGNALANQARILLILWSMAERTVSYEMLDRLLYETTLIERSRRGSRDAGGEARRDAYRAGWPVEISTRTGIGFKLRRLDPSWHWEDSKISTYGSLVPSAAGEAGTWSVEDRVALLSDYFPNAGPMGLRSLLFFIDTRHAYLDRAAIRDLWNYRFGEDLSDNQINSRVDLARRACRQGSFRLSIEWELDMGWKVTQKELPPELDHIFPTRRRGA